MRRVIITLCVLFLITFGLLYYAKGRTDHIRENKPTPTKALSKNNTSDDSKQVAAVTTIATGLEVPWGLAFLPNDDLLVTERPGTVRIIRKDGGLDPNPLLTLTDVKEPGEGGLHGITLHPDYPERPFVYLYYTYGEAGGNTLNRVVRYDFKDNKFSNRTLIVDQIPGAGFHDGGRVKFGPDKNLYITTGDAQEPSLSQDKTSLAGKILRVTDEGKAAPGNPFNDLIYSYGHRNPQGITWDNNNNLWETEHGQTATDELNLIEQGNNYGWPTIRGTQTRAGMETPVLQSGSETWAPGDLAFLNGSLFYGGLRGTALFEVVLDGADVKEQKTHFKNEFGRIREVIAGPDGMLYVTTSNRDGRGNPIQQDDRVIRVNSEAL